MWKEIPCPCREPWVEGLHVGFIFLDACLYFSIFQNEPYSFFRLSWMMCGHVRLSGYTCGGLVTWFVTS